MPGGVRRKHHDAEHELDVQALIRQKLRPVGDPNRTVLVGWDASDLGAVVTYRSHGHGTFTIDIIAVALRYRHRGGGWAREALATALDFITADADGHGYSRALVGAFIHEKNRPSQRLFQHEGFAQTAEHLEGYQFWSVELVIDDAIDVD